MLRIILFISLLTVCTQAKSYRLEYGFDKGQKTKYEFKGRHQARLVGIEDIRSVDERMEGYFEDEILGINSDLQARVMRHLVVNRRWHNGSEVEIDDFTSQGIKYEYMLDPAMGKVQVINSETFNPEDLMEMVVSFPDDAVKVGDSWSKTYHYNLSTGDKKGHKVKGRYRLKSVRGNIALIEGKFRSKLPRDKRTEHAGKLQFDVAFYFNMRKGLIERCSFKKLLRYDSRSKVAREFFRQAKQAGEQVRLGYTLKISQSFERVKDEF
tara:strand:- start:2253 stop:3053 length:801 start_codon:yes stop_codon:yes gene_type:complete